ncbi:MAG: hypothetical protein AB2421_07850 [Thermotaleaceae bacterium]
MTTKSEKENMYPDIYKIKDEFINADKNKRKTHIIANSLKGHLSCSQ